LDPTSAAIVGLAVMFVFMLFGMPIAFAMLLAGVLGNAYLLSVPAATHLLSTNVWEQFSSYGLSVIPLFVLMGQFAYRAGVTERLYDAAYKWVGRLPGGLAGTTIAACAGFSAICGSNSATTATMGTIALPEMRRYRYDPALSTGAIAVGGTLGVVIPPSVVLIVIAVQTEQSLLRLFLAGIVPGLILALLALRLEEPPRGPRSEVVPIRRLLSVPAFLALIVSGVLVTFTSVAFIFWGPDFVTQWKDFSQAEAGISLGITVLLASLLGVLAGGYVADWLQKRFAYGRILTVSLAFLAAAPFILWALATEEKQYVVAALFLASFFMSWYHGPVTAVIHDLMPRRAHATSVGLYMFITQLLGGVLGPYVVGRIDDKRDLLVGLQVAVGVMVAGALCMFLVIYFIRLQGLRHPQVEMYRTEADP